MSMHRASRAALSFLIVAVACLCAPPGAIAQGTVVVTLRLISQTPFTTPRHPILHVVIDAENASDQALQDLSVGIQIGEPIRSRSQYLESMTSGPGTQPLFALPFPQAGSLDPGATRRFTVDLDVTTAHLSSDDSLVYPAQVDLRTGVSVVATLNTAVVHLVRTPEEPMRFAWWAELTSPPPLAPDGRLADPAFEASIAPGGSLASEVAALHHLATDPSRGQPIDVVVQPSMLDALVAMAGGYDRSDGTTVPMGTKGALDAANLLASLKATAGFPAVQISTMPYSAPLIPSLVSSGLAPDLTLQRTTGDVVVSDVLGVKPVPLVARPPGGALNEASVDALALGGATTLLADAETVTRPPLANDYAPLPTASLDTTAGNRVDLVLPDPDTEALLRDPTMATDPVRIAQVLFGLMATIWRESPVPSPPTVRGVALGLPAGLPGLSGSRDPASRGRPVPAGRARTGLRWGRGSRRSPHLARVPIAGRLLPPVRRRHPRRPARHRRVAFHARERRPVARPTGPRAADGGGGCLRGERAGRAGVDRRRAPERERLLRPRTAASESGVHDHLARGDHPPAHGRSRSHADEADRPAALGLVRLPRRIDPDGDA